MSTTGMYVGQSLQYVSQHVSLHNIVCPTRQGLM